MAERGTYLVADMYDGDWILEEGPRLGYSDEVMRKTILTNDAQREGFAKCVKAGVRIAYGTDSGIYPHGLNAMQLPYMVKYDMTPMQAIQAATISAAELMQFKDSVGALASGKYADVIAVEGDALADLRSFMKVGFVMKGGTVYKAP